MKRIAGQENSSTRTVLSLVLLLLLMVLIWNVASTGLSSLLTTYAAMSRQVPSAEKSVRLDPRSADAHYIYATLLESTNFAAAVNEYSQAALSRPDDYVLWLSVARARELNGEPDAAINAAREAVRLAPNYAEPHYQLGNIMLRAGYRDEAFKELCIAGQSNLSLIPGVVELAWRIYNGDVNAIERAIDPKTPQMYLALGESFKQKDRLDAAIAMYAAAGSGAAEVRRNVVGELINDKHFKEAAKLWAVDSGAALQTGAIVDPGFERESNLRQGFGWSLGERTEGSRLSLDSGIHHDGNSSLKIEFSGGESDPLSPILSQLILVEPAAHYELRFATRAEEMVTGGLPVIVVIDPIQDRVLAQSDSLPKASQDWQQYSVKFDTTSAIEAVRIVIRRQCDSRPCPIFGRLWLDSFSLQRVS